MGQEDSGIITRILKDHYEGFRKMHSGVFPSNNNNGNILRADNFLSRL